MKERPILFNGDMVRAILSGRKTQTRRPIKPQPKIIHGIHYDCSLITERIFRHGDQRIHCPFGTIGDRLWVRESARVLRVRSAHREIDVEYQADGVLKTVPYPSRLAPAPLGKLLSNGTYREASRITLEITNVMVERVQDISDENAQKEGVTVDIPMHSQTNWSKGYWRAQFATLWDSVYGTWSANPWVWVIEFKVVQQ
jgi:hypothetical protein